VEIGIARPGDCASAPIALKRTGTRADQRSVHLAQTRPALALLPIAAATAIGVPLLATSAGRAGTARSAGTVRVTERDFSISAPKSVNAGRVTIVVRNHGPDTHELIVVRENGHPLPLRADGLTVNEEALQPRTAVSLDGGASGSVRQVHVDLAPGRYVLFCNMAGHYMGGMHTTLVVK
jgi:uncharacterized cupredoxin-like copper-binding protein